MTVRIAGLVALLAGAYLVATYAFAEESAPEGHGAQDLAETAWVTTVVAKAVDEYEVSRSYTGTIVAARRSELAFVRAGEVAQLLVDEGDRVAEGDVLACLDHRRLKASRREAVAELEQGRALLAELRAGPREQTIAAAEAEVRNLRAQGDVAARNLQRRRQLVATKAISREEYDEALFALKALRAQQDAAQKQLDELLAGTRDEQVRAQQARVEQLEASLSDIDHELEDSVLRAPYAGTIAARRVDEGVVVSSGAPVVDLIEDSRLEAWIGLPPEVATGVHRGDVHSLTVGGREVRVTLRSVRPELDDVTRTQNAVFAIAPSDAASVVAGQVARVTIGKTIEQPGVWTPAAALAPRKRGLWAVYVAEGEAGEQTVAARDVELISTDGQRALVRGTLRDGEQVIASGVHRVVEGQRVRVARDASSPSYATTEPRP